MDLSHYFLEIYNKKNNKSIKGFSKKSLDLLKQYKWPGNVRELQNIIERSVIITENDMIEIDAVDGSVSSLNEKDEIKNLKDAINDFKKDYIIQSLNRNGWNQTKTARMLEIQRTYLAKLIKELKIEKL